MQLSDKEKKRLYDIEYRRNNKEIIKAKKRAYNSSPAGRAMQKRHRIKFKEYHNNYCMQPEYRKNKKEYDKKYRAQKKYGEFWECALLIDEIDSEVKKLVPDTYERYKLRGYDNIIKARSAFRRHLQFGYAYNWGHVLNLSSSFIK